jgi:cobalt/nickel transport system permease protein
MSAITNALLNLRQMDELAAHDTIIHKIHPMAKIIVTMFFLVTVVSFGKYSISGLLALALYPLVLMAMADLPAKLMGKRLLVLEPFVLGIGLFSPFFDTNTLAIGDAVVSAGWITLLSILIKGTLTISAGLMLVATTGIDKVAEGLRMLKVPRVLVLQILLTYRYVLVLIEELSRMTRAYFLRAPLDKGIRRSVWGSFAGQLLLRTYDRARQIYISMTLRGFRGEYYSGKNTPMVACDWIYIIVWTLFFLLCRLVSLADIVAYSIKGVFGL